MPLRSPKMYLGVPTTGLVTVVATGLEQGVKVNLDCHGATFLWFRLRAGHPV